MEYDGVCCRLAVLCLRSYDVRECIAVCGRRDSRVKCPYFGNLDVTKHEVTVSLHHQLAGHLTISGLHLLHAAVEGSAPRNSGGLTCGVHFLIAPSHCSRCLFEDG